MKTIIIVLLLIIVSITTFTQNITDLKCTLLKPASFCDINPLSILPDSSYGTDCYWKIKTCMQMNKEKKLVGVILTFKNEKNNAIEFKTKYDNIKIKDKNNVVIHPVAMLCDAGLVDDDKTKSEARYFTKFKVKKYVNYWNTGSKTTIILLFPKAEKGDKFIIDNFIETEIQ